MELSGYETFIVAAYFLAFILGFFGNLLVLLFLTKSFFKPHTFNRELLLILLNLTIADLLTEVFGTAAVILAYCVSHPSGKLGDIVCKLISSYTMIWISTNVSVYTICFLAWERFKAATATTSHSKVDRTKQTIAILVLGWILGPVAYAPFIPFQVHKDGHCTEDFPNRLTSISITVMDTLSFFLFPVTFFCYTYHGIVRALRKSAKRVGSGSFIRRRVTRMTMLIVMTYLICWAPSYLLYLVKVCLNEQSDNYDRGIELSYIPAFMASASHPIVYTIHSKPFRESVAQFYLDAYFMLRRMKDYVAFHCRKNCVRDRRNRVSEEIIAL